MAEPKTIILNAGSPLTGDLPMNLTRASFQAVGGNTRVQRTSVPSGNVLDNELFGWFSPADVVLVTIHSTSAHPHDVVRHRMSTDAYTEHSLVRPVILVLAPGETLLFATSSAVFATHAGSNSMKSERKIRIFIAQHITFVCDGKMRTVAPTNNEKHYFGRRDMPWRTLIVH